MIMLEDDDEAHEARWNSRSGNYWKPFPTPRTTDSNIIACLRGRKGDTVSAKPPGGSFYWQLQDDDTPSHRETQYRHLDCVPGGTNFYNNGDISCPSFSAPSNNETSNDHEGGVNQDCDSANINEDDKLDYSIRHIPDDTNVVEEHGYNNSGDYHSLLAPSKKYLTRWEEQCQLLSESKRKCVLKKHEWEVMYQRLLAYKSKHGTTRVPSRYEADPPLGQWVGTQRQTCVENDRMDLLNDIGFEWNVKNNEWEVLYQRLLTYKKKHGNTRVPQRYNADPKLGSWTKRQRTSCVDKDRIVLLKAIGFEWNLNNDWGVMYQHLIAYKKIHGNTRVPRGFKADPQFGIWVANQRSLCKDKDRIDLLNAIGFEWNLQKLDQKRWGVMYQRLLTYKEKYGTTRVPSTYKADPKLAHWVHTQRQHCNKKYRIDLLNDIEFSWNSKGPCDVVF